MVWSTWLTLPSPFYVAHRGNEAGAPENTMASFRQAFAFGAPIETDIQMTRDQVMLAIHDETVDRTTGSIGTVADMVLDQIWQLDAGAWFARGYAGERIPLISELLRHAGEHLLLLEMKDTRSASLLARAISVRGLQPYVAINTYDQMALREAADVDPTLVLMPTFHKPQSLWQGIEEMKALGAKLCSIDKGHPDLSRAWVDACHAAGIKVVTWTHKSRYSRDRSAAAGVDGFINSDYAYISGIYEPVTMKLPYTDPFTRDYFGSGWYVRGGFTAGDGFIGLTASPGNGDPAWAALNHALLPDEPVSIRFAVTPRATSGYPSSWSGVQVIQQDEPIPSGSPVPSGMGGYQFRWCQDGRMQVDRLIGGLSAVTLAVQDHVGCQETGKGVTFEITLAPSVLRFKRVDTGAEITVADSAFRGGRIAFISSGQAAQFSSFSVSWT